MDNGQVDNYKIKLQKKKDFDLRHNTSHYNNYIKYWKDSIKAINNKTFIVANDLNNPVRFWKKEIEYIIKVYKL